VQEGSTSRHARQTASWALIPRLIAFAILLGRTLWAADCIDYDPKSVVVMLEGDSWSLRSGSRTLAVLAGEVDAKAALTVASQNAAVCSIEWGVDTAGRLQGIQYWRSGPSVLPDPSLERQDCHRIVGKAAQVVKLAEGGRWQLRAEQALLAEFATEQAAREAAAYVQQRQQVCFIGRSQRGPDRARRIVQYWK
jgi:hypothetical protein